MKKLILFIFVVTFFLSGCGIVRDTTTIYPLEYTPTPVPQHNYEFIRVSDYSTKFNGGGGIFIDREGGIVCYYVHAGTGIAISCLPITETNYNK